MKDSIIWYVSCEDLSCAWTKKEDAIKYVKGEAERCGWIFLACEGVEEDNSYLIYHYKCEHKYTDDEYFEVPIYPTFFNQKPYR